MSETIQTRTTQEQSGDYRVYATATVGGNQPVKGLAIHSDVISRVGSPDFAQFELSEDAPEPLMLEADKATSATIRMRSANGPAVRHVYVEPEYLAEFGDFDFDGEDTDLSAVPSLGISGVEPSSEDEYESDKEARGSADEAAEALFGGEDADDSDEAEADSEESEADSEEDEPEVEIDDEELGIA